MSPHRKSTTIQLLEGDKTYSSSCESQSSLSISAKTATEAASRLGNSWASLTPATVEDFLEGCPAGACVALPAEEEEFDPEDALGGL
jgi:hypothetical protein